MGPRLHRVHPGLIYQWQSGALNESYSDVWGETVDLINGREDEGEGDITAKRAVGLCSTHTARLPTLVTINAPAPIAKDRATPAPASFGPVSTGTGITADVVDRGPTPPTTARPVDHRRLLAARPTRPRSPARSCSSTAAPARFAVKVENAENAGAAGIIIGNNVDDCAVLACAARTPTCHGLDRSHPKRDGDRIVVTLATEPVNVTIKDVDSDDKATPTAG